MKVEMLRTAREALGSPFEAPGRTCPAEYRYSPSVFDREPEIVADTLYVVGGLYGNVEALECVLDIAARDPGAGLVFNGDFHWFDVAARDFDRVTRIVLAHPALRGNVETEIAAEESGAGCGCAYPMDVSDAEVRRSNEILLRLRETAREYPVWRERFAGLPMHLVAQVGNARVGIVHGDATALAGWGFAHDRLQDPSHQRWIESMFAQARVDIFASSHTCLPALRAFPAGAVANNGAAGMPNFTGMRHGLMTRISTRPCTGGSSARGHRHAGVHVDLVRIDYDHDRWLERFLASWPDGSPAHASYHRRIVEGPRFSG